MGRAIQALSQVDPDLAGKYQEHLNSNMNLVRQYPDIIQNRLARLQQEAKQQGVDPGEE